MSQVIAMQAQIVALDFDGVIYPNTLPFTDTGPYMLIEEPIPGAFEFIDALLTAKYAVIIFTARAEWPGMERCIRDWMVYHGLPREVANELQVTNTKIPATIYIDDRGFHFQGKFPPISFIKGFVPWNKKEAE